MPNPGSLICKNGCWKIYTLKKGFRPSYQNLDFKFIRNELFIIINLCKDTEIKSTLLEFYDRLKVDTNKEIAKELHTSYKDFTYKPLDPIKTYLSYLSMNINSQQDNKESITDAENRA